MKKVLLISAILIVVGLVSIALVSQAKANAPVRKIVVFKAGVLNEPARERLISKYGGVKVKDLGLIGGKAVLLSPKAEAGLAHEPGVLRVG